MDANERFDQYLEHLAEGLGHADRHAGLQGYCTGLMLPLSRKSVEPMAARVDPMHASAKHQALHHFVAKAEWSDDEMLRRVAQWVVPHMDLQRGGCWIIDDTGFPEAGHALGRRGTAILRDAWQAGQLPSRRERVLGVRGRQPARGLALVPARRVGRRRCAPPQGRRARRGASLPPSRRSRCSRSRPCWPTALHGIACWQTQAMAWTPPFASA